MSSNTITEKWINGKFESKVVLSLVQREQYLNPQISLIKGREYETKLGKAMQVQLGLNDLREMASTLETIISEMESRLPEREESKDN